MKKRDVVVKSLDTPNMSENPVLPIESIETRPSGQIVNTSIINVPEEFRPKIMHSYPPDNYEIFEEWYFRNTKSTVGRCYLPIFWTGYYVNNQYGKDDQALSRLQNFINSLDPSLKYYTICQYDDGILNDLSKLDIKVFGMSGQPINYTLPLLCMPHIYKFPKDGKRPIFANFIGRNTHQIRNDIFNIQNTDCYISSNSHGLDKYCEILSQSVFTLCPRGYGYSSFRIQEALQYGSIPVYISDKFLIPHDIPFELYGITIDKSAGVIDYLKTLSASDVSRKQYLIDGIFNSYYTYESNRNIITNELKCGF